MSANAGPRQPVESSCLASVGYDATSHTLEVEFRHGGTYQYFLVPCSVYEALMAASSKGSFFVVEIRSRFAYSQLTKPNP